MKVERSQLSLAAASRQLSQTPGSRRVGATSDLTQQGTEDKPQHRQAEDEDAETASAAHAGAGKGSDGRLLNITA